MVEFLKEIKGEEFTYEKGKRYVSIDGVTDDLKEKILVRQPNSPKKKNYWTTFPSSCIDDIFRILEEEELSWKEIKEEEILLQL